jgi:hypothetical protein
LPLHAPVWLVLIILSASLIGTPAGHAQNGSTEDGIFRSDTLEMTVRAGFGRLEVNGFTGNWAPFRIMISNDGEPISGRLVVRSSTSSNPSPGYREFIKQVNIPRGSRQLHEIAAFVSSDEPPEISIVSDDRVVAQTSVRVERSYYGNDQLEILVVDTDATTLNFISAADIARPTSREPFESGTGRQAPPSDSQTPSAEGTQAAVPSTQAPVPPPPQARRGRRGFGFSGQQGTTAHPVVVPPEDLPRDFVAYDPVDVVVIGDAPLGQLTEDQSRALRFWVASGGLLIVTGAADFAGLRTAGLDGVIPIDPRGRISAASVPELTNTYGRFESAEPSLLMEGPVRTGGRVLLGNSDSPLIAERPYGSGLVRFIGINPKLNPYRGWAASKDLWNDLLLPAAEGLTRQTNWITRGRRGNSSSSRWGVQSVLFRLADIKPPSSKYFLLFLLFYILAVGPINYFVLRWARKLDLAWLTIPAVVLAFTGVSVAVARISRGGRSIASDISLVELHQPEGLSSVSAGLLLMPTSKGVRDITLGGRETFANDVVEGSRTSSASAAEVIQSEHGADRFTLRVPMTTWTANTFQIRSMADEAQPAVEVTEEGDGSSGRFVVLRNLKNGPFARVVYLSATGVSEVVDLQPGREERVALKTAEAATFTTWYGGQLGEGTEENEVFAELAGVLDREIGGQPSLRQGFFDTMLMTVSLKTLRRPLLIGFVDDPPLPITFDGTLRRKSKALYVIHL